MVAELLVTARAYIVRAYINRDENTLVFGLKSKVPKARMANDRERERERDEKERKKNKILKGGGIAKGKCIIYNDNPLRMDSASTSIYL